MNILITAAEQEELIEQVDEIDEDLAAVEDDLYDDECDCDEECECGCDDCHCTEENNCGCHCLEE